MRLLVLVAACVAFTRGHAVCADWYFRYGVCGLDPQRTPWTSPVGITLGVDLSAEDGGVPERGIIFFNATDLPISAGGLPAALQLGRAVGLFVCAVRVGIPR